MELIQDCNEDSGKGYILEVDVIYHKELQRLPSDLSFLPKILKTEKCE